MSKLLYVLSYGLGAVLTFFLVILQTNYLWEEPEIIFLHLDMDGFSYINLIIVFLLASFWAYFFYVSKVGLFKDFIIKGEIIGFLTLISIVLLVSFFAAGLENITIYFKTLFSILFFALIIFGWLVALSSFLISYMIYKKNKES